MFGKKLQNEKKPSKCQWKLRLNISQYPLFISIIQNCIFSYLLFSTQSYLIQIQQIFFGLGAWIKKHRFSGISFLSHGIWIISFSFIFLWVENQFANLKWKSFWEKCQIKFNKFSSEEDSIILVDRIHGTHFATHKD